MDTKPKVDPIDPRIFQNSPVFKRSADHRTIYANVARTGITPFDVRVIFGHVVEPQPGDPAAQINEDLVTVIMSPEAAKAAIPLIQAAVQGYESQYGETRDIAAALDKMKASALARAAEAPPKVGATIKHAVKSKKS